MENDSRAATLLKIGLGGLGLGAVAAIVLVPGYGLWIALAIVVLALLFFGAYLLWRKMQSRNQRRQFDQFSYDLEAQTSKAPVSVSDPRSRAELDQMRQKFQKGLEEFKTRGKGVYKLPWYLIIGESGSGKTEALRHSGLDFPPGLQDELQGSGGTVNMDWWFTNRAVILDTAGKMVLPEARAGETPEWREFLKLLRRNRPHCPINGLFLVLSIESLIKDSADTISQKANRLTQQLDLIQRTLDVRFPVYLLVTKCDLLTGFREFFDNIEDPLLQHQMFGWSNPSPLDDHFRPDLVEEHLQSIAQRLRRRRLTLLRETSAQGRLGDTNFFVSGGAQLGGGHSASRRLDEVDALFALPESIMRLAPRLRRYLEIIFVAGEWSAKPVFLRGIYFTTSMREGKALDEAIALATGLPLDQLPEERNWDKNRAFFLRDLFHEKVFRESGLVTRATNTLQMLRKRRIAVFGSALGALLLVVGFAVMGKMKLQSGMKDVVDMFRAATNNWDATTGEWTGGSIVRHSPTDPASFNFIYTGTNLVEGTRYTVADFHRVLREKVTNQIGGGLIFLPVRAFVESPKDYFFKGQYALFDAGVLRPLVSRVREKIESPGTMPAGQKEIDLHRDALLSLMQLEVDRYRGGSGDEIDRLAAQKYLRGFLAYLLGGETRGADTNLAEVFEWTYKKAKWPPLNLCRGDSLASNPAINQGLEKFHTASRSAKTNIDEEVKRLNDLTGKLQALNVMELGWLQNPTLCPLPAALSQAKLDADASWARLEEATNPVAGPLTSLAARQTAIQEAVSRGSAAGLSSHVTLVENGLPEAKKNAGLFSQINDRLRQYVSEDVSSVQASWQQFGHSVPQLDTNCVMALGPANLPAYKVRWSLYDKACALASLRSTVEDRDIGAFAGRLHNLSDSVRQFQTESAAYSNTYPMAAVVSTACARIATNASNQLEANLLDSYVQTVADKLRAAASSVNGIDSVTSADSLFNRVAADLKVSERLGPVESTLNKARQDVVLAYQDSYLRQLKAMSKFPVRLDSTEALDASGLRDLHAAFTNLKKGLDDKVWASFPTSKTALDQLRQTSSHYEDVILALLDDGGAGPAEMEIWYIPPRRETEDYNWVWTHQDFQLEIGEKKIVDAFMSHDEPFHLGSGQVNAALKVSLRQGLDSKSPTAWWSQPNWALPRMIQGGKAKTEDGVKWRLTDTVSGMQHPLSVFEVRLKRPLPKPEDWPK